MYLLHISLKKEYESLILAVLFDKNIKKNIINKQQTAHYLNIFVCLPTQFLTQFENDCTIILQGKFHRYIRKQFESLLIIINMFIFCEPRRLLTKVLFVNRVSNL